MSSTDQIALITGANKGIGLEIAKQLAAQEGYHILLGSRDAERGAEAVKSLHKAGLPTVELILIDVASDASIATAAASVREKYGRLDVLINNAGIATESWTGEPPTREQFAETYAVNVFGSALTTEAFVPLLEKSTNPRIVFISSEMGSLAIRADPEGRLHEMHFPVYRSSKAALNMLALGYATKYREKGWKVNMNNPGFTATEMNGFTAPGKVEDAAKGAVRLAMLGVDGETGTFSENEGELPW
ncbi:hypothetical protein FB45DRAFT_806601 [Roridomyces roridus]|uniref:Short chain dehydrogenase n=1 Tax=Roridomyces roridus TaxID=1738132 RepID=A0AAD7FA62_9AGAR|nr:hypothetical protein FB45DRAFT_806601 [Roridomyces roridus]